MRPRTGSRRSRPARGCPAAAPHAGPGRRSEPRGASAPGDRSCSWTPTSASLPARSSGGGLLVRHPEVAAVIGSYDATGRSGTVSRYKNLLHHYVHQQPPRRRRHSGPGAAPSAGACSGGAASTGASGGPHRGHRAGLSAAPGRSSHPLDKALQVTHLKRWTSRSLLRPTWSGGPSRGRADPGSSAAGRRPERAAPTSGGPVWSVLAAVVAGRPRPAGGRAPRALCPRRGADPRPHAASIKAGLCSPARALLHWLNHLYQRRSPPPRSAALRVSGGRTSAACPRPSPPRSRPRPARGRARDAGCS